jgi:formamidopyrimidine-DNA glycosylase
MPELPEVETIARALHERLKGRQLDHVRVSLSKLAPQGPRKLERHIAGRRVERVFRRGKFVVWEFADDMFLVVHLKMTGQFLFDNPTTERPPHVHAIMDFKDYKSLFFRDMRQFGRWWSVNGEDVDNWFGQRGVGPDPFEISVDEFVQKLHARRGRIKPLLLNQQFISGLGNIYVDESLFATGIHPLTLSHTIGSKQARRLYANIHTILEEAIRQRGSTASNYVDPAGKRGRYQEQHRVYRRTGEECCNCGTEVCRTVVGGRGTHYCPKCQPNK